ncbi:helicase-related protein [Nocardia fluminea]|uniref:helicase-related protein n=1 Tax=Nocardia fluminea TaxID=134984 RepID=UPI003D14CBC9
MPNDVVPYTHWSLFDDESSARACAAELGTDYRTVVRRSQVEDDAWLLLAGRDVESGRMSARHDEVAEIVARHGGDYDGGEVSYLDTGDGLNPTPDPALADQWQRIQNVGTATSAAEAARLVQAAGMFTPVELAKMRVRIEDEAFAYGGYDRPQEIFNRGSAPRYLTEGPLKSLSGGERFGPTWLLVECHLRAHPDLYDETPASVQARQTERTEAAKPLIAQAAEHLRTGHFDQAHQLIDQAELIDPDEDSTYAGIRQRIGRLASVVDELALSAPDEHFDGLIGGTRGQVSAGGRTFILDRRRDRWVVYAQVDANEIAIAGLVPTDEVMPSIRAYLAENPAEPTPAAAQVATEADNPTLDGEHAETVRRLPGPGGDVEHDVGPTRGEAEPPVAGSDPETVPDEERSPGPDRAPQALSAPGEDHLPESRHAETDKQQASTPPVRLPAPQVVIPQSPAARVAANLEALELAQRLTAEQRPATDAEREVLARWTSWGAASQIFDTAREEFTAQAERLRELLADERAWKAANRTVLNAHYTAAHIVTAMWDHLGSLGFSEGRVLEPGSGAGAFIGAAPPGAEMIGIEVDPTTARIAELLHPGVQIRAESFADTRLPEGHFDAAIGNVPFGQAKLHDPVHNLGNHSMHNHFILKALALVKPGGVVELVSSSWTLDALNPAARREIAEHADFLGAVRLPNGAHRRVAGTDVLTDILVLRRRDGEPRHSGEFERSRPMVLLNTDAEPVTVNVNEYFAANPDMVLGEMRAGTSQYGSETAEVRVTGDLNEQLRAALSRISERAHQAGTTHRPRALETSERRAAAATPARGDEFPGHIEATTIGFRQLSTNGAFEDMAVPRAQRDELQALLSMRDTAVALLTAEAATAEDTDEIATLRARLNLSYDSYARRFGAINRCSWHPTGRTNPEGEPVMSMRRPPVMRAFREDPHAPVVMALETYDDTTDTATKMAIMRQRVVAPRTPRLGADTAEDAVAICLDTHGRIELDTIADLLGVEPEQARAQLRGLVYPDPDQGGRLVPAAEYLSGDVRSKLDSARTAAAEHSDIYADNVAPLIQVIPPDLGPAEIDARLGAAWVDADDVQEFLREVLRDTSINVEHPPTGEWKVTGGNRGMLSVEEFGTRRVPAPKLAQSLLRQSQIRVHDPDETGEARIFNPGETEAAIEKGEILNERFSEWVWENPVRATRLSETYNRRFNNLVLRTYDGAELSLPGLSKTIEPRPHQRAAVARMIAEPNVGLFHAVGAGKTLEMAMGVMELKRLGLVTKPAIVVPNHMLDQFASEFLQAYPQARVLAAGTEDLAGEKRRAFVARAATGDWDAVIMTRGSFQRLEVSNETASWYFDREIEPRRQHLQQLRANGAKNHTVKRIEDAILKAEEKLKAKLNRPMDPGITFEMTGMDYLVVDELHDYKNLATDSNIESAAIEGSQRAQKLHMVVEYLREEHNGRAITGATATPIANSITEAYVMQRYLRPDLLEKAGINHFDDWAATFGKTKTQLEMSVDGNSWALKTRFAGFRNIQELQRMFHVAADVKLPEDLNLPVPKLARRPGDGERAPEIISVPATEAQIDYVQHLGQRAQRVKSRQVDPREDNMLSISSDGRAAALDLRLLLSRHVDPDDALFDTEADAAIDDPEQYGLKIAAAADWMYQKWAESKDRVYLDRSGEPHPRRGGLVSAFCDLGTPSEHWNAYDALKQRLVAHHGVDPDLIAYIHDAKNDRAKARLFAQAKDGTIQFLLGSTSKMGVGTNVQARMVAMLHVDCPWRPADIEQRDGRGVRQGNQNAEIAIARVVTEGTFDARMWATQARKATFINQFMKGNLDVREVDDIGDAALSANEALAIASGNPLVLEKAELDVEVTKLDRLRRAHQRSQSMLQVRIREAEGTIPRLEEAIVDFTAAITKRQPTRGDSFTATIGGRWFDNRVEAGDLLAARLRKLIEDPRSVWKEFEDNGIGKLGGFTLNACNIPTGRDAKVAVRFAELGDQHHVSLDRATLDKGGAAVMIRLENGLEGLDKRLEVATNQLATEKDELARATARLGKPFEHTERLGALKERQKEINTELLGTNKDTDGQPDGGGDGEAATEASLNDMVMHDAAAMVNMMGGAAIVNGPAGPTVITRDTGRSPRQR